MPGQEVFMFVRPQQGTPKVLTEDYDFRVLVRLAVYFSQKMSNKG